MASKEERKTFLHDKSKARTQRKKPKLNEDTLTMQKRYEEAGYFNIAEIAYLMANDEYENLQAIEKAYGLTSEEYGYAFTRANNAVKTALPYFAIQMRAEIVQSVGDDLSPQGVEDALKAMIAEQQSK